MLNSLEFQEKILRWNPQEEVTVVLTDTSDYSNGRALASPRNTVVAELSPSGHFFETLPSNERFHSLADHELVHVATMDAANDTDRAWRRFFGGKPRETDEHPETILYNYLATPRNSTPRWFNEGSAVFFETWLAGGIGRAQGGYDEMVFRAMVRDDAHFYSPVGIVSAGTASDFQTMSNAYLYGTRFISWLGLTYSPEKVADWMARDRSATATTPRSSSACSASRWRRLERLDRLGARVPGRQPGRGAQVPADHRQARQPARARLGVALLHRPGHQRDGRRLPVPGRRVARRRAVAHRRQPAPLRGREGPAEILRSARPPSMPHRAPSSTPPTTPPSAT
jgi:hypothetical protein